MSDPTRTPQRSFPARVPFFYGWLVLPAAAIGLFASGPGQTFTVSVFIDSFIEEFGWTRTQVSGLYTAGSLTAAATMFGVGSLLDRFGARTMLIVLSVLMGLALVWMSTVDNRAELYGGFVALRVIGQGSLTLVPQSLVAIWFIRKRGRMTAFAGLGMVAAQVLFPSLGLALIEAYDWRTAWLVLGAIVTTVLLPVAVLIVRRSPESVGLHPDGNADSTMHSKASLGGRDDWTLRQAMHTWAFWLVLFASAAQSLVSTALVFHQVDVLGTRGISAAASAAALGAMGPASFAGVLAGGFMSDRYSNRHLLAAGQGLIIVSMVAVMLLSTSWQAVVYGGMLGFAGGFSMTVSAVIWPNYFGRRHLGSIRGVAATMMVASAALGPLSLALGYDIAGSYATVIGIGIVIPAVCGAMAYAAKAPRASQS